MLGYETIKRCDCVDIASIIILSFTTLCTFMIDGAPDKDDGKKNTIERNLPTPMKVSNFI